MSQFVQQVQFGNTGIKVAPIIIGCMSFGDKISHGAWVEDDKEKIFKVLKHAYDRGLRTYDTADVYSNGKSELFLGEFLKKYNIPRETVVIMTKVWGQCDDSVVIDRVNGVDEATQFHLTNMKGLSRKHIMTAVKNSMRRLGTYIDVYQIHRCDQSTQYEETMRALNDCVEKDYVRYIGASSMLPTQFCEYQFTAEKHGWAKFVNMQTCYNLIYREDERDMIPYCKRTGVAITPWSPIQKGLLCKPLEERVHRENNDLILKGRHLNEYRDCEKEIILRIEKLAKKKNVTMADIALGWTIAKGTIPILGLAKLERVDEAINALAVDFTEEDLKYLEEPYLPRTLIM